MKALEALDKIDGTHIIVTFLVFAAVGFVAVYVDSYVVQKLETAAGIPATAY